MTLDPRSVLERVRQLPVLPRVVHELNEALRDDGVPVEAIVSLVASDPGLTAASLKLANTPFYGVRGRVVSLRDAVQVLGLQTLTCAVTTAAVKSSFEPMACAGFDFDGAWRHALASAVCAQTVAQARGIDECVAYTCGLMHDMGALALGSAFPVEFDTVQRYRRDCDATPLEAERRLLGIDHAEVGAALAEHWSFAPVVTSAIRHHHHVDGGAPDPLLDTLHFADNLSHALDLSREADSRVPPMSLATWERLGIAADELQALFVRIESRLAAVDLYAGA